MDYSSLTYKDGSMTWTNATSAYGIPYRYGYSHKSNISNSENAGLTETIYSVHWPGGSNRWLYAGQDLERAGLKEYKITHTTKWVYFDYQINIINTKSAVFYFEDETGDRYKLSALAAYDHYVQYDSKKPTIIRIFVFPIKDAAVE